MVPSTRGNITRAEVATIIYRIYTADVAKNDKSGLYATYNKFSDMAGRVLGCRLHWLLRQCRAGQGLSRCTFKPSGKVTGYEVLAMILRAVGYDKNGEFSGADWALHVAQTAQQAGVLKNVKGVDLTLPLPVSWSPSCCSAPSLMLPPSTTRPLSVM